MIAPVSSRGNAPIVTNILVAGIGAILLVLYRIGLHSRGVTDIVWFIKLALVQSALYLIVVWLIVRARGARSTLLVVLLFAGIFRLSVVFAPPYLSDDIYRYVWDGRVQAAGINPYRYIPADEHLQSLRDEAVYPKINRRDDAHKRIRDVDEADDCWIRSDCYLDSDGVARVVWDAATAHSDLCVAPVGGLGVCRQRPCRSVSVCLHCAGVAR